MAPGSAALWQAPHEQQRSEGVQASVIRRPRGQRGLDSETEQFTVLTWRKGRGGSGGLFHEDTNPTSERSTLMTETPPQSLTSRHPLGGGFLLMNLGGEGAFRSQQSEKSESVGGQWRAPGSKNPGVTPRC